MDIEETVWEVREAGYEISLEGFIGELAEALASIPGELLAGARFYAESDHDTSAVSLAVRYRRPETVLEAQERAIRSGRQAEKQMEWHRREYERWRKKVEGGE